MQRSYHLLREAAERYEVHLAALVQRTFQPTESDLAAARQALEEMCASVVCTPIRSDKPPTPILRSMAKTGVAAASLLSRIPYEIKWLQSTELHSLLARTEKPFDICHVDTVGLWPYVARVNALATVLNHHNIESCMLARRASDERNPIRRAVFAAEAAKLKPFEAAAARAAALNLVVSKLDAERLAATAGACRTSVIPNGIDPAYFGSVRSAGSNEELVFAGGMSWYPNRDAMLFFASQIWPRLSSVRPQTRVTIIGRAPPRFLLRLASRDRRIRLTGFVEDVRPYVERAGIYICPIRTGGGTRLKVLDALAMRRALVATEFAVEGLGLEPDRHYLRAETPDDWVQQICRAQDSASLRKRVSDAGSNYVERHFSWPTIGRRLAEAYHEALLKGDRER